MTAREAAERIAAVTGCHVRGKGAGGFMVRCPVHSDLTPSVHVSRGKRQAVLVKCLAGCETHDVLDAAGLHWAELCGGGGRTDWSQATAEYAYRDPDDRVLFVVSRLGHGRMKHFSCHHIDHEGRVRSGSRGIPRVLYRLSEVMGAVRRGAELYLCEGEKDADAMRAAYGVVATTNAFGGLTWGRDAARFDYAASLQEGHVTIVQHRDQAGRQRTAQVLASLRGCAASIRVVEAAEGNDAADHIAAGLGLANLREVLGADDVVCDDGSFAALPNAFFEAARACGLSHLEYRLLVEIARLSVRREGGAATWLEVPCSSSRLASAVAGSQSRTREALSRLRKAGILRSQAEPGRTPVLVVNGDFGAWRAVERGACAAGEALGRVIPEGTGDVSCGDDSRRADSGVREDGSELLSLPVRLDQQRWARSGARQLARP